MWKRKRSEKQETAEPPLAGLSEARFGVPGVTCAHCQQTIEGALKVLPGVAVAEVDLQSKAVRIAYDSDAVGQDALVTAIKDSGYDVTDS